MKSEAFSSLMARNWSLFWPGIKAIHLIYLWHDMTEKTKSVPVGVALVTEPVKGRQSPYDITFNDNPGILIT